MTGVAKRSFDILLVLVALFAGWQALYHVVGETALTSPAQTLAYVGELFTTKNEMFARHAWETARAFLMANKEQRYDPKIVDAFVAMLDEMSSAPPAAATEMRLSSDNLKPGMVLARDLINSKGMLLLPRGRELNAPLIAKIRTFEREEDRGYTIHVQNK